MTTATSTTSSSFNVNLPLEGLSSAATNISPATPIATQNAPQSPPVPVPPSIVQGTLTDTSGMSYTTQLPSAGPTIYKLPKISLYPPSSTALWYAAYDRWLNTAIRRATVLTGSPSPKAYIIHNWLSSGKPAGASANYTSTSNGMATHASLRFEAIALGLSMVGWAQSSLRAAVANANNGDLANRTKQNETIAATYAAVGVAVTTYAWLFSYRWTVNPSVMESISLNDKVLTPAQSQRLYAKSIIMLTTFTQIIINNIITLGFGIDKLGKADSTLKRNAAILQISLGTVNVVQFIAKNLGTYYAMRVPNYTVQTGVLNIIVDLSQEKIKTIIFYAIKDQIKNFNASGAFLGDFLRGYIDDAFKNIKSGQLITDSMIDAVVKDVLPKYTRHHNFANSLDNGALSAMRAQIIVQIERTLTLDDRNYLGLDSDIVSELKKANADLKQKVVAELSRQNVNSLRNVQIDDLADQMIASAKETVKKSALGTGAQTYNTLDDLVDEWKTLRNAGTQNADEVALLDGIVTKSRSTATIQNTWQIIGTMLGLVSMGLTVGMLANSYHNETTLTEAQKNNIRNEIIVQVFAGVAGLAGGLMLAAATSTKVVSTARVFGSAGLVVAGIIMASVSPMQVQQIKDLRNYATQINDLNNSYGGNISAYSGMASYYNLQADWAIGNMAVSIVSTVLSTLLVVAAAMAGPGSVLGPISVVVTVVLIVAALALMVVEAIMKDNSRRKIINAVKEAGGASNYLDGILRQIYQSEIYSDESKASIKDLQNNFSVQKVLSVTTIAADSVVISSLAMANQPTATYKIYTDAFVDGVNQTDSGVRVSESRAEIDIIPEENEQTAVFQLFTPLFSASSGRTIVEERAGPARATHFAYVFNYEGVHSKWTFRDNSNDSYIDLSNVVDSIQPKAGVTYIPRSLAKKTQADFFRDELSYKAFLVSDSNKWVSNIPITLDVWGGGGDDALIIGTNQFKFYGESGNNSVSYARNINPASSIGVTLNDTGASYVSRKLVKEASKSEKIDETTGATNERSSVLIQYRIAADYEVTRDFIDTLINVDNITGTAGRDVIVGNKNNNVFAGGPGQDVIYGNGGDDVIVQSTPSYDTLYGGDGITDTGTDTITYGSSTPDGTGVAYRYGKNYVTDFNMRLYGILSIGNRYSEEYNGANIETRDQIVNAMLRLGGTALDAIDSRNVQSMRHDYINGFEVFSGSPDQDLIIGSVGNDVIGSGGGSDFLYGLDGNDTLLAAGPWIGAYFIGGNGSDMLSFAGVNDHGVMIQLSDDLLKQADGTLGKGNGLAYPIPSTFANGLPSHYTTYIDYSPTRDKTHNYFQSIENVTGTKYVDYIFGNSEDNVLSGGLGADWLYGNGGNDYFIATIDNDTIDGGLGGDVIEYRANKRPIYADLSSKYIYNRVNSSAVYSKTTMPVHDRVEGVESIIGTRSPDIIIGDSNDNTIVTGGSFTPYFNLPEEIYGGEGDDIIIMSGGPNNALVDGGIGSRDLVDYSRIEEFDNQFYRDNPVFIKCGINVNNTDVGSYQVRYLGGTPGKSRIDRLRNIEIIALTDYADEFNGGVADETILGLGGSDILIGGSGSDVFYKTHLGGSYFDGGMGATAGIEKETDSDLICYPDMIIRADGNGIYVDLERGRAFNFVPSYSISDYIDALTHDKFDRMDGIVGTSGQDFLYGNAGNNYFDGRHGNLGVKYQDKLYGMAGNDQFDQGSADQGDYIDGGDGSDTVNYTTSTSATGLVINLSLGFAANYSRIRSDYLERVSTPRISFDSNWSDGYLGSDSLVNIENIIGSNFDDVIHGDSKKNQISGALGRDKLYGGGGDDNFIMSPSKLDGDIIDGGDGTDTIDYSSYMPDVPNTLVTSGLSISLSDKTIKSLNAAADSGTDSVIGIENIIGTRYSDTIIGDNDSNYIDPGLGADTIKAGGGDDYIEQKSSLSTIDGGDGNDTVSYKFFGHGVNVSLAEKTSSYTNLNRNYTNPIDSIESVIGSKFDDVLTGNNLDNTLIGSGGEYDRLLGLGGNDYIIISTLKNYAHGGSGINSLDFSEASDVKSGLVLSISEYYHNNTLNSVSLNYGVPSTLSYHNFNNIISGAYDDTLTGNTKDNRFDGKEGNDSINGREGNDVIDGGSGNDTIKGGSGNDTLIGGSGFDHVDGESGDDSLFQMIEQSSDQIFGGDGIDTVVYYIDEPKNDGVNAKLFERRLAYQFNFKLNSTEFSRSINGIYAALSDDGSKSISSVFKDPYNYFLDPSKNLAVDQLKDIENISGTLLNDTIMGNLFNNYLSGNDGDDVIFGREGNDTLEGGVGADVIDGGDGHDSINGQAGSDQIFAGNGDDSIKEIASLDSSNIVHGGDGFDTLSYAESKEIQGRYIILMTGFNSYNNVSGFELSKIIASDRNVSPLATTYSSDNLWVKIDLGTTLDIQQFNLKTYDVTYGIYVSTEDISIAFDRNAVVSNPAVKKIAAEVRTSGSNSVDIRGGGIAVDLSVDLKTVKKINYVGSLTDGFSDIVSGIEMVIGTSSHDRFIGSAGDDSFVGYDGNDFLHGNAGADTLTGGRGSDFIFGGADNDTIFQLDELASNNFDNLDGGDGVDTLDYTKMSIIDVPVQSVEIYDIDGTLSNALQLATFNVTGKNTAGDIVTGVVSRSNRKITVSFKNSSGTLINVTLQSLKFSMPSSMASGNIGISLVSTNFPVISSVQAVEKNIPFSFEFTKGLAVDFSVSKIVKASGFSGVDSISNIETFNGSIYADVFQGATNSVTIDGHEGNDIIFGSPESDYLKSGIGRDTIYGGDGNDTIGVTFEKSDVGWIDSDSFDGGAGSDLIDFSSASSDLFLDNKGLHIALADSGNDLIQLWTTSSSISKNLNLTQFVIRNFESIVGTKNDDYLVGDSLDNILQGYFGNDDLRGNGGNDFIEGSTGNDLIYGGDGNDSISDGIGNDRLFGGSGDDVYMMNGAVTDSDTVTEDSTPTSFDTVDYSSGFLRGGYMRIEFLDSLSSSASNTAPTITITISGKTHTIPADSNFLQSYAFGYQLDVSSMLASNPLYLIDIINNTVSIDQVTIGFGSITKAFRVYFGDTDTSMLDLDEVLLLRDTFGTNNLTSTIFSPAIIQQQGIIADLNPLKTNSVEKRVSGFNASFDKLIGINDLTGTAFSDTITGNANGNKLLGGLGNDILSGLEGDDQLDGDEGTDILSGGAGDDVLYGNSGQYGSDKFDGGTGNDAVDYSRSYSKISARYILIRSNIIGVGSDPASFSVYSNGKVVDASAINKTVSTSGSSWVQYDLQETLLIDSLLGSWINRGSFDIYMSSSDFSAANISEFSNWNDLTQFSVTNNSSFTASLGGITAAISLGTVRKSSNFTGFSKVMGKTPLPEVDTITGIESVTGTYFNDTLSGNSLNNIFNGAGGDDIIQAGSGDDIYIGGSGADRLTDSGGSDQYYFQKGDGEDTITDTPSVIQSRIESDSLFFSSIDINHLWFSLIGGDLVIKNLSSSSDTVTVKNWTGTGKLEQVFAAKYDANSVKTNTYDEKSSLKAYSISSANIDALVSAMALFGAPTLSANYELSPSNRSGFLAVSAQQLAAIINTSWAAVG